MKQEKGLGRIRERKKISIGYGVIGGNVTSLQEVVRGEVSEEGVLKFEENYNNILKELDTLRGDLWGNRRLIGKKGIDVINESFFSYMVADGYYYFTYRDSSLRGTKMLGGHLVETIFATHEYDVRGLMRNIVLAEDWDYRSKEEVSGEDFTLTLDDRDGDQYSFNLHIKET